MFVYYTMRKYLRGGNPFSCGLRTLQILGTYRAEVRSKPGCSHISEGKAFGA